MEREESSILNKGVDLLAHRNWGGSPKRHFCLSDLRERLSFFAPRTNGGLSENQGQLSEVMSCPNKESTDFTNAVLSSFDILGQFLWIEMECRCNKNRFGTYDGGRWGVGA